MHEIFLKEFSCKHFLIFFFCVLFTVHSIKCIIPCFFIPHKYHIFLLKKSCFKYFSFSLSMILKSNLMLMKSWKYQSVFKRIFFVPKLLFYTFDIYLYNTTIPHFMCSVCEDHCSSVLLNDKST